MNLTIVCVKCKFTQFTLQAVEVDSLGSGYIRCRCVRCGADKVAGIDLEDTVRLPVKNMSVELPT